MKPGQETPFGVFQAGAEVWRHIFAACERPGVIVLLVVLSGCVWTPTPPFEIRNEFDQLLDRQYGLAGFRNFDNDLMRRTRALLHERLPEGTQVAGLLEFFGDLGGTCKHNGKTTLDVKCEYCREKVEVRLFIFENSML